MLLVANLVITKWCKTPEKCLKPWHMGTHLSVLSESYSMNTTMTRFRWFSKMRPCALDESSLCIRRVKTASFVDRVSVALLSIPRGDGRTTLLSWFVLLYIMWRKSIVCFLDRCKTAITIQYRLQVWSSTVPTFNSRTRFAGSPGIIHNRTPGCNPVSWAWTHGWPHNWTQLWFTSYMGHWCAWLIFLHVILGYLYNQALADVRLTGAGIKCLYCIRRLWIGNSSCWANPVSIAVPFQTSILNINSMSEIFLST